MSDIQYPPGCKPITEDIGTDELIRRLKVITTYLQMLSQDDGTYHAYVPLALHLADEFFLQHQSRDVQLLIACCIADVMRVYAPDAPYKDVDQVKCIFNFIIKQLNGLRDPKDTAFKRYFYLLENLAFVKSFNMCLDIADWNEIACNLFSLMFRIVSDEHSAKVKTFMLEVLSPLVSEADTVSLQLLDIILINIVEPQKTARKNSYRLARDLIKSTHVALEQYIRDFFNSVLVIGVNSVDRTYGITSKVYELIYELNVIEPSLLLSVLPHLEHKLKSIQEAERLRAVSLLAQMFSEKDSQLAKQHTALWRQFLSRFNDIAVNIRVKCVQSSMHFLINHPHLRAEIIETLKLRQHDTDESVRYEVVMAIVETSKRDFQVVSESDDLLEYVKERTLDKKLKIRREAMNGLAMIYKTYLIEASVPEATRKAVVWIKDKILHGYYMTTIEDRILVERLLITCLVPYQLPAEDRMKKLYRLLGTIDNNATKAFIELQRNQQKARKTVADWVKLHRIKDPSPAVQKEMSTKCMVISKQLPDALKAHEFLLKFSGHMRKDAGLLADMETILKHDVSCKDCASRMASMLKKLGQPIMVNLYYNTVKMLMERIASVLVDRESIEIFITLVSECMQGGDAIQEIGLTADKVGERGLRIVSVLAFIFGAHFQHASALEPLLGLLSFDEPYVAPYILKAFTYLGKFRPLADSHPQIVAQLLPICKELAISGTPKQAKHAVRCMFVNMGSYPGGATGAAATSASAGAAFKDDADAPISSAAVHAQVLNMFGELVDVLKHLQADQPNYRTLIVLLGHIAYNLPDRFQLAIKNTVSRKIVRELLVRDAPPTSAAPVEDDVDATSAESAEDKGAWCTEDELPELTRCKVEALKAMARWLMGLKQDIMSAQKTFRMLNAFVKQRGNLMNSGNLTAAEMSWLRLSAGTAMLKICEQKGVGDQFSADQLYDLSQLMHDPVLEVRDRFARKLHKGLNKGIPLKCLPMDFMGLYALAGRETDKSLLAHIKSYVEVDVQRRREYVKTVSRDKSMLSHMLPDYMLVFAVALLAHDPQFTNVQSIPQLKAIERCLWLVLEPLVNSKDDYCFAFYKTIIDRMKNHKDAVRPDDDEMNTKMWAICDIALHLIFTKTSNYDTRDFPVDARIPSMYFKVQPDDFTNTDYYLPADMYYVAGGPVSGRSVAVLAAATTSKRPATYRTASGRRCWADKPQSVTTKDTSDNGNGEDQANDDDDELVQEEEQHLQEEEADLDDDDAEEDAKLCEPITKRRRLPTRH